MVSISEAVSSVSWGDFIGYVLIFAAPEERDDLQDSLDGSG
jgi:hypothetical protein